MDLQINLLSFDEALEISNVCERYSKLFDIDAVCGRYVVDASSILGMESLVGNSVIINIHGKNRNQDKVNELKTELIKIKNLYE